MKYTFYTIMIFFIWYRITTFRTSIITFIKNIIEKIVLICLQNLYIITNLSTINELISINKISIIYII